MSEATKMYYEGLELEDRLFDKAMKETKEVVREIVNGEKELFTMCPNGNNGSVVPSGVKEVILTATIEYLAEKIGTDWLKE